MSVEGCRLKVEGWQDPAVKRHKSRAVAAALLIAATLIAGAQPVPTDEADARRRAALEEFTRKMKDANYPALFDQAAKEFNVPADVLKAVSFAETRWDHLTWTPGETVSPETGMPRPYGIMSLWDNQYFGHSLIQAAQLIGKDPEELKRDPLQNIRGAAALLRNIYDATPRPDGSSEAQSESWRYAIRKYCGIPEPDLNARHALDVYTFMSKGYHDFGIEWEARPVNLEPIREETRRIIEDEQKKRALAKGGTNPAQTSVVAQLSASTQAANLGQKAVVQDVAAPTEESTRKGRILLTCLLAVAVLIVGLAIRRKRRD
jgi:hypothetical protein